MRKKWLALPLAVVMAGTLVLGAACGKDESGNLTVTVQDGYVYVNGENTGVSAGTAEEPVVTVQDGYVYVNGKKTDIAVGSAEAPQEKSAFELWKEKNPGYTGTEQQWNEWLGKLTEPQPEPEEESVEYKLIENGVFGGKAAAGSATTQSGALKIENAALRLEENVVLPFSEGASWEVNITGKLLTGNAGGAQFFAGNPFTDLGRVYLGVNKSSKMLYVGVRMNELYINYGWLFEDASVFTAEHSYRLAYEGGLYTLSVDGAAGKTMDTVNFNQNKAQLLATPEADAKNLNKLIHTVAAQDCVGMTNLGVDGFLWNAEIKSFTVKTSVPEGYKNLLLHPLASRKIFYLGSSITRGEASNGVAFGEIIHALTDGPFQKEAVSGTTLVDNGPDSYVQRLRNFDFTQKPDCLIVQLSTNDFSQGKTNGEVQSGTASAGFDKSTISGAIQYIIAYVKEQCPTCKVLFYTGKVRGSWGYNEKYKSYIENEFAAICAKWNITPLDLYNANYKNYPCYWSDDIHPTIEGYTAGWVPLFMEYLLEQL